MTVAAAAAALASATLLVMTSPADAKPPQSSAAVAEFKRSNTCPATGQATDACPGYSVDHIVAPCAGGESAAANMQWRTVADARQSAGWEPEYCRFLRVRAGVQRREVRSPGRDQTQGEPQ